MSCVLFPWFYFLALEVFNTFSVGVSVNIISVADPGFPRRGEDRATSKMVRQIIILFNFSWKLH